MTYYLVKSVGKATENNKRFSGRVITTIHGKEDYLLFMDGGTWEDVNLTDSPYFIREYGYKRICDAKRNYSYKNPENNKYWQTVSEIITMEA